jgi:hypothetical protein
MQRVEMLLCNDREISGYCRAVSGQQLGKHVSAARDTKATTEELCFLCGPFRDVSKGQGETQSILYGRLWREDLNPEAEEWPVLEPLPGNV